MNILRCLAKDNKGVLCDGSSPYKSNMRKGDQSIQCRDPEGTCKRSTCECDKAFVLALRDIVDQVSSSFIQSSLVLFQYNPLHHIKEGFNRETVCKARTAISSGSADENGRGKSGGKGEMAETQCCGVGLERKIFKVEKFQCCQDQTIKLIGNC